MKDLKKYENKELDFKNLQQQFIQYIDVEEKTLQTYSGAIKQFIIYMQDNNIKNPTREDIISFREYIKSEHELNTVNGYLIAIRQFFKFLEYMGIYKNITENIKGVKISKLPKKQVLNVNQVKQIYNSLTDLREKCLFGLMITTGCRGVEVSNAKLEDIKYHNGEIVLWIQCKGHQDKDEYVKLSNQVLEDIKKYVGDRKQGYIFTSTSNHNNGDGVTTTTLRRIIKNIFKRFGLDSDTFSLHSLRRSNAVISYENGSSIYDIKQVLHHSNINTTTRYLQQVNRDKNKTEYLVSNAIFN